MKSTFLRLTIAAALAFAAAGTSAAQVPRVQTAVEALAQDAAQYMQLHPVTLTEAMARLTAQEESVAATDRIAAQYRDRLAGIAIEHDPAWRIVVLLTGSEPVPEERVFAGGMNVPILFRTGAATTQDEVVAAMTLHRDAIRKRFRGAAGMGVDPRTGELVVLVKAEQAERYGETEMDEAIEALTGVPVRIEVLDRDDANAADESEGNVTIDAGSRVEGVDPANGRRYACTTGFVVSDGTRVGIVTAAHCPDSLSYVDPVRGERPLEFVGGWGARYQDVQVHVGDIAARPLFYADRSTNAIRKLTSWRNRASTRGGDVVCHRGESTGYSCAEVMLTDYAPPGDLCGGPCEPLWVAVAGPSCRGGDSGGPIFNGTVAFGIVKGGNYRKDGRCNFYFYMSTDYLPEGWSLLHG